VFILQGKNQVIEADQINAYAVKKEKGRKEKEK
jgi:hypothetical protein